MNKAYKRGLVPKDPTITIIDAFESDFETKAAKLNRRILDAWTLFQNPNGFNSRCAFENFNQCIMQHAIARAIRAQQPIIVRESDLE